MNNKFKSKSLLWLKNINVARMHIYHTQILKLAWATICDYLFKLKIQKPSGLVQNILLGL